MIKIRKGAKKDIAAIADIWHKEERLSEKLESFYRLKKNAIRKLRASRIVSAKLTDKKYEIPAGFDKHKYL